MEYEETKEINYGKPPIDLLNKYIREQDGIQIFYRLNLKKDKRPYWKGKIMDSVKTRKRLITRGIELYGNGFKPEKMGLTVEEIESANYEYHNDPKWGFLQTK